MSATIEQIDLVTVSPTQQRALRKLALRNSKYSASEFSQIVFDRAVKNAFTPLVKTIAEDAAKKYDMAVAGGFEPPCTKDEYVKRAAVEYRDILSELESA
jgi:hypothetical protein